MHVESGNPVVVTSVNAIAETISAHGGTIADDFVVREENGQFSCAIRSHPREPGRVLVAYPRDLTVPMDQVVWNESPDVLEPISGLDHLDAVQRNLLDNWLLIINSTDKVAGIRRSLPRFAVDHWGLRHHLADAGFPQMRQPTPDAEAKNIMVSWHCGSLGPTSRSIPAGLAGGAASSVAGDRATPPSERFLIPLKHFVNHDPAGAEQIPIPGMTAVVTSAASDESGTYENYGDLDAMQLLVNFGYVDSRAPLVHSVPTEVHTDAWGKVVIEWRGTRAGDPVQDIPRVETTADGLRIHHLTARPGNRGRIATLLAMVGQSAFAMAPADAKRSANDLIDGLATANVAYYERLDHLVMEARRASQTPAGDPPSILADIAAVSLLQRERLQRMWG